MTDAKRTDQPTHSRSGRRIGSAPEWLADYASDCGQGALVGVLPEWRPFVERHVNMLTEAIWGLATLCEPEDIETALVDTMTDDGYWPCGECGSYNIESGVCLDCAFEDDRLVCPRCHSGLDGRRCTDRAGCGYIIPDYLDLSPPMFVNHYRCPVDGTEWDDEWTCTCNDHCPTCNAEIEPYASDDLSPDAPPAGA